MVMDIILLLLIYIFVFLPKWKAKGLDVFIVNSLMYIYIGFVLYFTLMPIVSALPKIFFPPFGVINTHPFSDLVNGRGDFIRQICLNIIMMMPFGILFPLIHKKRNTLWNVVLFTFLFSLSIEIIQPMLHGYRSFDVTDLLTNTFGGLIGFVVYIIMMWISRYDEWIKNTYRCKYKRK